MNKLIPLSEYVLLQTTNEWKATRRLSLIIGYAEFLRQPLTLGMFVPVDDEGNFLAEPEDYEYYISDNEQYFNGDEIECQIYSEAMDKLLFLDAIKIDDSPYQSTNRIIINLSKDPLFRIYTELRFWNGNVERDTFPNNKNLTIEDLVKYGLPLTPSALKMIGKE